MDKQLEQDLAQEARRGGRAILAMYANATYRLAIPLVRVTRDTPRMDRDRANGTFTTAKGTVYSREQVQAWAAQDARAGRR